jgi:hypothetical protein
MDIFWFMKNLKTQFRIVPIYIVKLLTLLVLSSKDKQLILSFFILLALRSLFQFSSADMRAIEEKLSKKQGNC